MKILKGIFKFIIGLLVVAGAYMLYAENANYTFDKEKAADYVTKNAEVKSRTWCAWYVMRALQEGGCPIYLLPAYGYSWLLPRMDFVEVNKDNYEPHKGDLIVFPAIGKHIWGHIQMWNGQQWVSDFRQKNMIPAKAYHKTNWKIFRHKGKKMKTKIIVLEMVLVLFSYPTILRFCTSPNENYLQAAKETTKPNTNFMFASNASLLGRIYMTFSGKDFLPCINTATSFFNKYHTCSNCEDFEKSPEKWNFMQIQEPQVGDIVIQHNSQTGRAYHAAIIVNIKNGKLYVNHALKKKYIKNAELKNKGNLTFYRFTQN